MTLPSFDDVRSLMIDHFEVVNKEELQYPEGERIFVSLGDTEYVEYTLWCMYGEDQVFLDQMTEEDAEKWCHNMAKQLADN